MGPICVRSIVLLVFDADINKLTVRNFSRFLRRWPAGQSAVLAFPRMRIFCNGGVARPIARRATQQC